MISLYHVIKGRIIIYGPFTYFCMYFLWLIIFFLISPTLKEFGDETVTLIMFFFHTIKTEYLLYMLCMFTLGCLFSYKKLDAFPHWHGDGGNFVFTYRKILLAFQSNMT